MPGVAQKAEMIRQQKADRQEGTKVAVKAKRTAEHDGAEREGHGKPTQSRNPDKATAKRRPRSRAGRVKTRPIAPAKKTAARRKPAGKKTAAKKPVRRKAPAKRTPKTEGRVNRLAKYNEEGDKLLKAAGPKADTATVVAAGKKLKMSGAKAQRLYARATLKPSQRIVVADMDEAKLAKEVVRLVDVEGLKLMPDVWARTNLGPARLKALYAKGGGKGRKTAPKATAKKTAAKAPRKTRTAKAVVAKGGARKKTTAKRGRRARSTSK